MAPRRLDSAGGSAHATRGVDAILDVMGDVRDVLQFFAGVLDEAETKPSIGACTLSRSTHHCL